MPTNDYTADQQTADDMIVEFGATAILRREDFEDRYCVACEIDATPQERIGKLMNAVDRIFLVSVYDPTGALLDPPPQYQRDVLITLVPETDPSEEDETLKIMAPVGRLAPAVIPVYYELQVRG